MSHRTAARIEDRLPASTPYWFALVAVELLLVGGYFALTPATLTEPRYALYPFVWINLGLWGALRVHRADRANADPRVRAVAGLLATAYFLALASLAGLIAVYGGGGHSHAYLAGWQVVPAQPGWGPRISYVTAAFHLYFVPYRVAGYLALAYLLYAALVDAAATAVSGVLGVASCLGCSFPAVAALLAGAGGSAALVSTVSTFSIDLSTAVLVVAVGLLVWRPRGS